MIYYLMYCEEYYESLKEKSKSKAEKKVNKKDIKEIQNKEMKMDEDLLQELLNIIRMNIMWNMLTLILRNSNDFFGNKKILNNF